MTAKDYLSQAYKIDRSIKSKLEQIQRLESLATEATQAFGENTGGGSHDNSKGSKLENMVVNIVELKEQTAAQGSRLLEIRRQIAEAIHCVDNLEYEYVLEERYLNYKSWNDMCDGMAVSKDYLYHVHGKALKKVPVPSSEKLYQ